MNGNTIAFLYYNNVLLLENSSTNYILRTSSSINSILVQLTIYRTTMPSLIERELSLKDSTTKFRIGFFGLQIYDTY